jgi:hypothetical protein
MRALDDIRNRIFEYEKTHKPPLDFYREYTNFLIEKLKTISTVDSEGKVRAEMPVFYANPERAVAKLKEDRNLILPLMSVAIDDIDDDPERRRTNHNVEISKVFNKATQKYERVVNIAPKAVKLSFLINFWAKYLEDLNQMMEGLQPMFNPALSFKTKFSTQIQGYVTQVSDNSTTVLGDKEDRVLRKIVQVTIDTYVPSRKYLYTSTGEIKPINFDFEIVEK